jgi:hypothetical protein
MNYECFSDRLYLAEIAASAFIIQNPALLIIYMMPEFYVISKTSRDVALLRLYIGIHTSIAATPKLFY